MSAGNSPEPPNRKPRRVWDWLAGIFLFLATAGVVIWQNSRLTVLWDLSYILENSWRIRLGDIPYRDFPFPYAPLTFLAQALLIRLTGRVFFHHVIYCAVVGGLATVIAWQILKHLLNDSALGGATAWITSPRAAAFLLAMPLTIVGIYGVFPHPFYDPDCTFAVLFCVLLLLNAECIGFPPLRSFLTGMTLVVPVFVKQNTGLAFLAAAGVAIVALLIWRKLFVSEKTHPEFTRGYICILAGIAAAGALALAALHFTVGLRNYHRWTIQFAAARRLPSLQDMLAPYWDPTLAAWLVAFAAGLALLSVARRRANAWLAIASVALLAAPFLWILAALFIQPDSEDRAASLLTLWPYVLIVSLTCALWNLRRGINLARLLPFILIATIQGAFLSQQVWGSTYAIWPLLILLLAVVLIAVADFSRGLKIPTPVCLAAIAAVSMLICSAFYVASEERPEYVDLSGVPQRSSLPVLAGLRMSGPWLPDFEELVAYAEREIPRDDALLMIPGEDLFYYTTGRRPRFPVLMFDHTVNPYAPEQIANLAREQNVRWLIVKRKLQLNADPVEDRDRLIQLLAADFAPAATLKNYVIFNRTTGASKTNVDGN